MRTIDRIRCYIQENYRQGRLQRGSKLPSYHELMEIGRGSYATVRSAMAKLESEGLIEIRNGTGSYLSGGDILHIRLNINTQALPIPEMRALLSPYLERHALNIEVDIQDANQLRDPAFRQTMMDEESAVVTIVEAGSSVRIPRTQLDHLEGYQALRDILQFIPGPPDPLSLPFACYTYQLGFSREIMQRIGFDPDRITGDISGWWDDYADRCHAHGVHPATLFWPENTHEAFMRIYGLIFTLTGYDRLRYADSSPLFLTAAGRRMLDILDRTFFYPFRPHPESFFMGGAGLCFGIGSWMTRQNQSGRRPDIHVHSFDAVPFEHGGRRIYPASMDRLVCSLQDDLPLEKRNRVWQFMKLLLSREFQLEYCNQSGMISLRNDIAPDEYTWNINSGHNSFFPHSGDRVIYEDEVFPESVRSALSLLLEDYKLYGADADAVLKRMDTKKNTGNPSASERTEFQSRSFPAESSTIPAGK